eukprot:scaffold63665_cov67-Phaeocystis_antarctica.AAC.5
MIAVASHVSHEAACCTRSRRSATHAGPCAHASSWRHLSPTVAPTWLPAKSTVSASVYGDKPALLLCLSSLTACGSGRRKVAVASTEPRTMPKVSTGLSIGEQVASIALCPCVLSVRALSRTLVPP